MLERIKIAMGFTTDVELSAFLGVSKSTLSNWKGRGSIDYDLMFSKCEQIHEQWIIRGEGAMLKEKTVDREYEPALPEASEVSELPAPIYNLQPIPFVSINAIAGFGSSSFSLEKRDVKDYYVIPKFKDREIDFMIEVSGSSMYPKYNSGDVVACRIIRESKFIQWNKVHVVATKEQGILIKRLRKSLEPECLLAVSDNVDYAPFDLPENEIDGIAIVVGVVRLE